MASCIIKMSGSVLIKVSICQLKTCDLRKNFFGTSRTVLMFFANLVLLWISEELLL